MIKIVFLGLLYLVLLVLFFEIGYCRGFEDRDEMMKKDEKGEDDEEKNC